jgi:hypothetical protein
MVSEHPKTGDWVICRYPGGFAVGRWRLSDDRPLWDQETSMPNARTALRFALTCAARERTTAWWEVNGEFEVVEWAMLPAD